MRCNESSSTLNGEVYGFTSSTSPFVQDIQVEPLLANFRLLTLEVFDDNSNPVEQTTTFRAYMSLYGTSDVLMC